MLASIFLSLFFFLFQTPTVSTPQNVSTRPIQAAQTDETPIVQKHSVTVGAKNLNYTTTTGFMPIKNSFSGETEARIFYIAYSLDNSPTNRPLMFSFNGGPGSASVWLHLGALGPKRVKMQDDGTMPAPPYQLVDNDQTWLTETDMVFIDPVGTGYSRATKPEFASKFFGLDGDLTSVAEFIRMYLGRYER
ncbi:MAG TPA: hypothetical protein PKY82_26635, partial [Pyrinomonadaceae bacterium]|nr:hypothetical protein [Pyrinomonadaceae bacterium]